MKGFTVRKFSFYPDSRLVVFFGVLFTLSLALVALIVSLTHTGPAGPPGATTVVRAPVVAHVSGKTPLSIGQTLYYVDDHGNSEQVRLNSVRRQTTPLSMAPLQGTFVVANVTFTGIKGTSDVNPMSFTVRTADGASYQQDFSAQVVPFLDSGSLFPGDKSHGNLVFDAPANVHSLVYTPSSGNGSSGVWKF